MDRRAQLTEAVGGRYTIEREIGRGGMATVYLAHDVRHDRQVALKVLDPELAAMLGTERFLSEIRVTANLQHPNLLPLFDSGAANGLLFYVMPYVDGETLRARLDREKQLPIDDAVRIAIAIANALDYAHSHNVIHRDLKPENILIQAGQPVIADFGIALAVSNAGGARMTQTGMSLGTPQYMSPEQASGERNIDGRTDVYSLGAITYEMLVGATPHAGANAQQVIARMMTEDAPHVSSVRRAVPQYLDAAIARALEKLPADRWSTAREFAVALSGVGGVSTQARPSRDVKRSKTSNVVPWAVAATCAAAAAAAIAFTVIRERSRYDAAPVSRFPIAFALTSSDTVRPTSVTGIPFAVSPDDRRIAYVGTGASGLGIFVRNLDSMRVRQLVGAERGIQPTFSPDGRSLAFLREDHIAIEPIGGGTVQNVIALNGQDFAGMDWARADTMIASIGGALVAVPTNSSTPVTIARPDAAHSEKMMWGPRLLNDRYVAYISVPNRGLLDNHVAIYDRRTKRASITELRGTTLVGALGNYVLWATYDGSVMAARIDRDGKLSTPELVPIENMLVGPGGAAKVAMSARGTLVYRRGTQASQLMLVDDRGVGTPVIDDVRTFMHPRFSPDGSKIAISILRAAGADIWIADPKARALSKFSTADGTNDQPAWTPDGKRIAYFNGRIKNVLWSPIDGTDSASVLVSDDKHPFEVLFTHDAKTAIFRTGDAFNARAIFYAPVATAANKSNPALAFVNTPAIQLTPVVSPDDKWVAYASNESGRMEVYAKAFPGPGPRVQISPSGGQEPVWSRDGQQIFYRSGRQLVAATIATSPNTLAVSDRRVLFEGAYMPDLPGRNYDVAPDGKHFLMLQPTDRDVETVVVYAWGNQLRRIWRN